MSQDLVRSTEWKPGISCQVQTFTSHPDQTLNSYVSCCCGTNFLFGQGQMEGSHTTHHLSFCVCVCVFSRSERCQRSQSWLDLWPSYKRSHPQLFSQRVHTCVDVSLHTFCVKVRVCKTVWATDGETENTESPSATVFRQIRLISS